MNEIIARVNVEVPSEKKIVHGVEKRRAVRLEYPFVGKSKKTYSHKEVFAGAEKVLNDYFENP